MESLTYQKNLDIAPKKLRMLLPKVKKLSPLEATKVLFYSPRKAGQVFYKVIKSAIANAKQTLKVNDDLLQFKLFTVEEGNKLKRYQAGSRGNAKPFKKRYSHIKIILTAKAQTETSQKMSTTKKLETKSSVDETETQLRVVDLTVKASDAKKESVTPKKQPVEDKKKEVKKVIKK